MTDLEKTKKLFDEIEVDYYMADPMEFSRQFREKENVNENNQVIGIGKELVEACYFLYDADGKFMFEIDAQW